MTRSANPSFDCSDEHFDSLDLRCDETTYTADSHKTAALRYLLQSVAGRSRCRHHYSRLLVHSVQA
jgi:hypothetical protein